MITEEQFAAIKRLIVSENCMIDRFEHYVSEIKEPQLKEDMQKLTAALKNQRSGLLTSLEDKNIKEARFFVKAYSKEFCQTYSDLCGSPFAECIKSALDGQLRIAEKLESLEKTYCDKTKLPIADSIDVNRFLYNNREDMR